MNIRHATPEDVVQIVELFHTTVHTVNARDYTAEQLDAWSPRRPDPARWRLRMASRTTFVADDEGVIAGFCELQSDGRIDCFYCRHTHQRQGVGSLLLAALEDAARAASMSRLYAEASITARPFFEARGFHVVRDQHVVRQDVKLTNFVVEKKLEANQLPRTT